MGERRLLGAIAVLTLLLGATPAAAQDAGSPEGASDVRGDDLQAVLRQADALYARREAGFDGPNIRQGVDLLEQAVARHPDDYGASWRLARWYFWKADGAADPDVRAQWGQRAAEQADKARALNPKDVRGWYFGAAGVGLWSQGMGILSALTKGMEGKFRERIDRALEIDPDYDCGGPMITMGRYYYELPWPKYDDEKSIEWLRRALQACPDNVRAMTYLAETYLKEDRENRAGRTLDRALSVEPQSFEDPPEARRALQMAREVRQGMK